MSIGCELNKQVNVAFVAETIVNGNDVGMFEEKLDFDLADQLVDRFVGFLLRWASQTILVYHLQCSHETSLQVLHQKYLTEPPSPQFSQDSELAEAWVLRARPCLRTLAHGRVGLSQLGKARSVFQMFCLSFALSTLTFLYDLLTAGLRRILAVLKSKLLLERSRNKLKTLLIRLLQALLLLGRVTSVFVPELLRDKLATPGSFRFGAAGKRMTGFDDE